MTQSLATRMFVGYDAQPLALYRVLVGAVLIYLRFSLSVLYAGMNHLPVAYPWLGSLVLPASQQLALVSPILLVCAILIMLGLLHRVAALVAALIVARLLVVDLAAYNPLHYLALLILVQLVVLPASNTLSVDNLLARIPGLGALFPASGHSVPRWAYSLLCAQALVTYTYNGASMLSVDWLVRGEPLRQHVRALLPSLPNAALFDCEGVVYLCAYLSVAFYLLICPLLSWRLTRPAGVVLFLFYRAVETCIYGVRVQPVLESLLLVAFFAMPVADTEANQTKVSPATVATAAAAAAANVSKKQTTKQTNSTVSKHQPISFFQSVLLLVIFLYVLVQIMLPLRTFLYPHSAVWTGYDTAFSWRQAGRTAVRQCSLPKVTIQHRNATDQHFDVQLSELLHPIQYRAFMSNALVARTIASSLRARYAGVFGQLLPEIRYELWCSLNNGPVSRLYRGDVDASTGVSYPYSFVQNLPPPEITFSMPKLAELSQWLFDPISVNSPPVDETNAASEIPTEQNSEDSLVIEDEEEQRTDGKTAAGATDLTPPATYDMSTAFKLDRSELLRKQRQGASEFLTLNLPIQLGCGRMVKVAKSTRLTEVYSSLDCRITVDFMFVTPQGYLMPRSPLLRIGHYNLTNGDELDIRSDSASYLQLVMFSAERRALNARQSSNSSYELTDEDNEIMQQAPDFQKFLTVLPDSDVMNIRTIALNAFQDWNPQPYAFSLLSVSQNVVLTRGPIGDYKLPNVETVLIVPTTVEQVQEMQAERTREAERQALAAKQITQVVFRAYVPYVDHLDWTIRGPYNLTFKEIYGRLYGGVNDAFKPFSMYNELDLTTPLPVTDLTIDQLRITNGSSIVVVANHLSVPSAEDIKKLHRDVWPEVTTYQVAMATHILDTPLRFPMKAAQGVKLDELVSSAVWSVLNSTHPHKWDPNTPYEWRFQDVINKTEWSSATPVDELPAVEELELSNIQHLSVRFSDEFPVILQDRDANLTSTLIVRPETTAKYLQQRVYGLYGYVDHILIDMAGEKHFCFENETKTFADCNVTGAVAFVVQPAEYESDDQTVFDYSAVLQKPLQDAIAKSEKKKQSFPAVYRLRIKLPMQEKPVPVSIFADEPASILYRVTESHVMGQLIGPEVPTFELELPAGEYLIDSTLSVHEQGARNYDLIMVETNVELQLLVIDMHRMPIFQNLTAEELTKQNNATRTIAVQQKLTTHGLYYHLEQAFKVPFYLTFGSRVVPRTSNILAEDGVFHLATVVMHPGDLELALMEEKERDQSQEKNPITPMSLEDEVEVVVQPFSSSASFTMTVYQKQWTMARLIDEIFARMHREKEACWVLHAEGVFRDDSFHELVATLLKLVPNDTIQLVRPTF